MGYTVKCTGGCGKTAYVDTFYSDLLGGSTLPASYTCDDCRYKNELANVAWLKSQFPELPPAQ